MQFKRTTVLLVLCCFVVSSLCGDIIVSGRDDPCLAHASCGSCLVQRACTWCVTKSLCTQQLCGNDNVIYPAHASGALLSGPHYCPRLAETKQLTFASGKRRILEVKLTQIYLYMAFTPWKCKIHLNGKELVVPALLVGDTVYCESFLMKNESEEAYVEGWVKVLWDYNKAFDGSLPIKVCRCDLEPNCVACKS